MDDVILSSWYALIDPDKKNHRVPQDGNKPLTLHTAREIEVGGGWIELSGLRNVRKWLINAAMGPLPQIREAVRDARL